MRAASRRRTGLAGLLTLACALGACGDEPAPGREPAGPRARAEHPAPDVPARPHVVLVTIDTLRADRCSAYGYERPTTPHLDALAREGALFEVAYAPTPTTLPSHAVLMSSLYPGETGVRKNGQPLPEELDTLAERLRRAGYRTAAFVSSFVVSRPFRLDQGFDSYDDDFRGAVSSVPADLNWSKDPAPFDRRAADTTDAAIAWLRGAPPDLPFFLWVHYFDPHQPLIPLEPYLSQFARPEPLTPKQRMQDLYDAEVRSSDDQLGRLLGALDEVAPGPRTLVLVTSDHGEGLWDHGWLQHGALLYEEAVRVPLVLRWPGRIEAGLRLAGPVGLIDVLPTLLGLLALEPGGPALRGADLGPLLEGAAAPDPDRRVFLQRQRFRPGLVDHRRLAGMSRAVRWRHWKLIESPQELGLELFDLERDPHEFESVASQHPDLAKSLKRELEAWQGGLADRREPAAPLPEAVRRGLEALGYAE